MEFPSEGMASVAEAFCFLVGAEGILSSDFLFFSATRRARSSLMLPGVVSVGVVLG